MENDWTPASATPTQSSSIRIVSKVNLGGMEVDPTISTVDIDETKVDPTISTVDMARNFT